ncbi:uncharacterized protein LOC130747055 isoform X2 [Lotus japonicus]|uniref:uncharacterized protein LOC130747055 isoform X2 n=1 Tax=Lotus japonicus TaxID=34305 RepID=UPI002583FF4E|nr:uncharacterized protein LOC130747055 isoform X2 [Lotus japonicus]
MGGALAIASSVLVPDVDGVVAFYGVPSAELADPAQAKSPVQAHFGELDDFVGFSNVTFYQRGERIEQSVSRMMTIIDLARNIRERHNKPLKTPLREMAIVHPDADFLDDISGKLREMLMLEGEWRRKHGLLLA